MLFKPALVQKIIAKEKTQTRRLVKDYEFIQGSKDDPAKMAVFNWNINKKDGSKSHTKWVVGRSYAVQKKRGGRNIWWNPKSKVFADPENYSILKLLELRQKEKTSGMVPLRIKLTRIRQMKLKQITGNDARAEGFNSKQEFLEYFYHVNGNLKKNEDLLGAVMAHKKLPDPAVWALTFVIAEETNAPEPISENR